MKTAEEDNILPFRPPIRNKRVWASVAREAESVIEEAFLEALQRDPEQQRRWVVLIDGLPHQIRLINSATKRELDNRGGVDKCANYLLKNKERLQYGEALKSGFPIASGVIEGACRHIINDSFHAISSYIQRNASVN